MLLFQNNFSQKITALILIFCFVGLATGPALFLPRKAQAVWPVEDVVHTPLQIAWEALKALYREATELYQYIIQYETVWRNAQWLVEWTLGVLLNVFLHQILADLTNQIVNWIQNDEMPRFLSMDFENWLGGAANNAGGIFVDQFLGAGWLCEPFDMEIKIALLDVPTFETEVECTITDIVDNINDFYDDFSKGGWKAWLELTKPQNTFAGAYLLARDEKQSIMQQEIEKAKNELEMGDGFLSPKDCYWYDKDGNLIESATQYDVWGSPPLPDECPSGSGCTYDCEINTPASIVQDAASKTVTNYWDQMNAQIAAATAKAGPYSVYVQAIVDALINRVLTEGMGLLHADPIDPTYNPAPIKPPDPADNFEQRITAQKTIGYLELLKSNLRDYLLPEQEENLAAWMLVESVYENDVIPVLNNIISLCEGSNEYNWAVSKKAEVLSTTLPYIQGKITELSGGIIATNKAIGLTDDAIIETQGVIDAVDAWEIEYHASGGVETDELIKLQGDIDEAILAAVEAVQYVIVEINIILPDALLDETANTLDALSDEVYTAYIEITHLSQSLTEERGNPDFPEPNTIYYELEVAEDLLGEAERKLEDCAD